MGKKPTIPSHPDDATMKAVCFTSFGKTPDVLSVQTIPEPTIDKSSTEVLIKVHACALNPIDKTRVEGDLALLRPEKYDISVLGYDVAGVMKKWEKRHPRALKSVTRCMLV